MFIKQSDKCDECGKAIKKTHFYKNKSLCGMCYRRQFTIIQNYPLTEPFNCIISFSVALTESQKKILDQRVNFLFPQKKNNRRKYLRALILGDIEFWNTKINKKNSHKI